MTTTVRRILRRETVGGIFSGGKVRPVIVSIEPPNVLGFRLKGTRKTYYLTAEGCYLQAVQAEVASEKRAKAKGKPRKREVGRGIL